MSAYYDTGVLVPFYVNEVFSDAVATFVENRNEPLPLNAFHQLELENALRLKVFRGELDADGCRSVLDKVASHVREGKIAVRPVDWIEAMDGARRIGANVTAKAGCRTLDLLHVAIAVQWKSEIFVTADDRQLKAARSVGLQTVDVRTLPRDSQPGDTPHASPTNLIREKRARYRTRK